MAMHLFPHNETAYQAAVHMLSERCRAAVVHPTGTGKSFIGFKLCEDNPDRVICWLSPSRYIYQTQLENLAETSNGFQHLEEYIHTYGLAALTQKNVCSDGYKLGNWFGNCKRRYKSGNKEQQYIDRFAALEIDLNKSRQGT